MHYYFDVLKKYAVFSGRASRKEYWMFYLLNAVVIFVLSIVEGMMGVDSDKDFFAVSNLYSLAIFLPSLGLAVRRMHDVDKNGWFILIPIYNFILTVTAGTKGENQYGPDPWGSTPAAPASVSTTASTTPPPVPTPPQA